jgi:YVTN family beta-propeller protein
MKFKIFIILGLLLSISVFAVIENASALSLTTTIPTTSAPTTAIYDSGNGKIYATRTDNTVAVISDTTNTVTGSISVGKYPYGGCYDSAKGEIYIGNHQCAKLPVPSL